MSREFFSMTFLPPSEKQHISLILENYTPIKFNGVKYEQDKNAIRVCLKVA
jgi:hypothetical protein